MPVIRLVKGTGQALFPAGHGTVLIINSDMVNPVWIGTQRQISAADIMIGPQASITVDGSVQYYGSTLTGASPVDVLIVRGGLSYSPGLPVTESFNGFDSGSGQLLLFTFPEPGRVFTADVSCSLTSDSSYAGSNAIGVATVQNLTSGLVYAVTQAAISGPSQASTTTVAVPCGGLPAKQGDQVGVLLSTVPNVISHVSISASVNVLYSIP